MNTHEETFARLETKYMLSLDQAVWLTRQLHARGFQCMTFGSPKIQSLYYDTEDFLLIRQSLARPVYKEKLRLRVYGEPGCQSAGFAEIKKKYNHMVYKRRVSVALADAPDLLDPDTPSRLPDQIGLEIDWMVQRYHLIPRVLIAYDREAWINPEDPGVRITFDRNLSFRAHTLDLSSTVSNTALTLPDQRLMEIKIPGVYPLWLIHLLEDVSARRCHYSKYGDAYTRFIQPGALRSSILKGA